MQTIINLLHPSVFSNHLLKRKKSLDHFFKMPCLLSQEKNMKIFVKDIRVVSQ